MVDMAENAVYAARGRVRKVDQFIGYVRNQYRRKNPIIVVAEILDIVEAVAAEPDNERARRALDAHRVRAHIANEFSPESTALLLRRIRTEAEKLHRDAAERIEQRRIDDARRRAGPDLPRRASIPRPPSPRRSRRAATSRR